MKTIYDAGNEDALATQGYKPYKDATLKSMSKDDLIDQIRCLEHNWAGEIKANKLLSYRLKCFLDVLDKNGHPEKFSQICALPGEYGYSQEKSEPNLNLFCEGRDDYWYNSWLCAQRKIRGLKNGIKDIKTYNPKYYDKDLAEWFDLDIDYLINNSLSIEDLEERERIDNSIFPNIWNLDEMTYFTEEEQKAEERIIKEMSVEHKDNFFDYYEEDGDKNEKI